MKVGPSGSAIRSLIVSHRELLRSKAVVVSVAAAFYNCDLGENLAAQNISDRLIRNLIPT
jgi:hypothetical protein